MIGSEAIQSQNTAEDRTASRQIITGQNPRTPARALKRQGRAFLRSEKILKNFEPLRRAHTCSLHTHTRTRGRAQAQRRGSAGRLPAVRLINASGLVSLLAKTRPPRHAHQI